MSILQEYEAIRKNIGEEKYQLILSFLEYNPCYCLSDVYFKKYVWDEMEDWIKDIIKVSKEKWDSIHSDYKGTWQGYYDEKTEWIGRKVVMSGCITNNPNELGKLLVEGVHFIIVDNI